METGDATEELRKDAGRTAAAVLAARAGDQRALDELIAAYLPLLYNVVGRALSGHPDVDDVVQETMIRMVGGLPSLRDPARFRSWLIAIAVREIRDKLHDRRVAAGRTDALEAAAELADPGADFADLTILRLGLSGQRRQVADATRWLDDGDRELLALWWLEAAGELDRSELAAAMGFSVAHAAVRVQRMRAQLDTARAVVGALAARPRCPELEQALAGWDGAASGLWRKRIARHARDCVRCAGAWAELIPADRLLVGVTLVPVPLALAATGAFGGGGATTAGIAVAQGSSGGIAAWLGHSAWAKPIAAVAAGLTVTAGTIAAVEIADRPAPPAVIGEPSRSPGRPAAPDPPAASAPSGPSPSVRAASPSAPAVAYGSVVDAADAPPPRDRRPPALPKRAEGTLKIAADGDNDARPDVSSFIHRGEWVTLSGRGYLRLNWQVPFQVRAGRIAPPTWTGLKGKLFHVASGGGHRMDDTIPGQAADHTYLGNPEQGRSAVPDGVQQFWAYEYFHLDGEVTFTSRESGADYNIYLHLVSWQNIVDDVTGPPRAGGPDRYGLVRDPGTDACPVPQYATRSTDAAQALQRSAL